MKGCRLLIGVFDPSNLVRSSRRRRRASGVRLRDEHRLSSLLRRDARDSSARRGLDPRRRRVANRAHRRVPRPRGRRRGARDAGRQDASRAIIAIIRENGGFRGRTRRESGRRRAFDDGVSRVLARVRPMTRREKTRAHVPFVSGRFATRRDADGGRRRRNPRQPIRERFRDGVGVNLDADASRGRTLRRLRRRVEIVEWIRDASSRRRPGRGRARHADRVVRIVRRLNPRGGRIRRPVDGASSVRRFVRRLRVMRRFRGAGFEPAFRCTPRRVFTLNFTRDIHWRRRDRRRTGGGGTRARPRVVPPHRRGSPFARRLVGRAIREREWAT